MFFLREFSATDWWYPLLYSVARLSVLPIPLVSSSIVQYLLKACNDVVLIDIMCYLSYHLSNKRVGIHEQTRMF